MTLEGENRSVTVYSHYPLKNKLPKHLYTDLKYKETRVFIISMNKAQNNYVAKLRSLTKTAFIGGDGHRKQRWI